MTGQRRPDVSIVIPAYNEERRIGRTLERICAFTPRTCTIREVLVVDDGSRDGTVALVERLAAAGFRSVRVLRNPANRGKGYAVRHGVLAAEGSAILFSDADLSTPVEELDQLVPALARADVVIGSRALPESVLEVHQPLYRELSGRTFNLLFQALVLPGVHDSQCGFKLFDRTAARDIFPRLTVDGFGFDIEILYVARRLRYRIEEVGVRWIDDPDTKVTLWKDAPRMFSDLLRVRWRHRGLSRPSARTSRERSEH
jgi:dolichyl-phosphate beta-glucosyltransferase